MQNDPFLWAYEIAQFFQLQRVHDQERLSALRIQRFFKNCKKIAIKHKFRRMVMEMRGQTIRLTDLPEHIVVHIFTFMETQDHFTYQAISKKVRQCLLCPYLLKEVRINKHNAPLQTHFQKLIMRPS